MTLCSTVTVLRPRRNYRSSATYMLAVKFFRRMSLTQKRHHRYRSCRIIFTVPTALLWNFPHPRGNYRGYRGITAFTVTVSSSRRDITLTPLMSVMQYASLSTVLAVSLRYPAAVCRRTIYIYAEHTLYAAHFQAAFYANVWRHCFTRVASSVSYIHVYNYSRIYFRYCTSADLVRVVSVEMCV